MNNSIEQVLTMATEEGVVIKINMDTAWVKTSKTGA
jgi:hypothetical protein